MFAMAVRCFSTKPSWCVPPSWCIPRMTPIEKKATPEPPEMITRAVSDIVKKHGPLTISETWERIQGVGLQGLTSRSQLKTVLRWMKEKRKLRLICNQVGPDKQFLLTTWFAKSNSADPKPEAEPEPESSPSEESP